MSLYEYILIGFSLAMDSFSVTVAKTISNPNAPKLRLVSMPVLFGLFQGLMPLIGGTLISSFKEYIEAFDHWIAFALLLYIGINLIREAKKDDNIDSSLKFKELLILSIATSIDALSVGISFVLNGGDPITGSLAAGIVTFFVCLLKGKASILGGCILIAIGVKILIEHLFFM